jgi:Tfp pilus assembly protein PilO
MNTNNANNPLSQEYANNLIVSIVAVLAFIFLLVVPSFITARGLEQKLTDLRFQLKEHQTLQPLYESLKKSAQGGATVLVNPAHTGNKEKLDTALQRMREVSGESAMTVTSLQPDLDKGFAGDKSIVVNVSLKGRFENFWTLLSKLGALPFLDNVETISIQRTQDGKELDFKLKVLLAVS